MFGRSVARLVLGIGLLVASVAWTGWVVLQTVADPTRSSRVAHAVLDDPDARAVIADDLTASLAKAINAATSAGAAGTGVRPPTIAGDDPRLRSGVGLALDDPEVITDLVDAFAAQHANLLGVEPRQEVAMDTGRFVGAVATGVRAVDAGLADRLVAAAPATIEPPDIEVPYIGAVRRFAIEWVPRLAMIAAACVLLAFALGDRRRVARRAGTWAVGAGLLWVLVPRGIIWVVERWSPAHGALVRAVVQGATGEITALATLLVLGGLAAVAASVLVRPLPRRRFGATGSMRSADERFAASGRTGRTSAGDRPLGAGAREPELQWAGHDLTPGWRPLPDAAARAPRTARRRRVPPAPRPGEPYDHLA